MNDFTLEELKLILHYHPHGNDSLCNKARKMIESYCDHDCKATIWESQVTACSKCGFPSTILKVKNDNQQ